MNFVCCILFVVFLYFQTNEVPFLCILILYINLVKKKHSQLQVFVWNSEGETLKTLQGKRIDDGSIIIGMYGTWFSQFYIFQLRSEKLFLLFYLSNYFHFFEVNKSPAEFQYLKDYEFHLPLNLFLRTWYLASAEENCSYASSHHTSIYNCRDSIALKSETTPGISNTQINSSLVLPKLHNACVVALKHIRITSQRLSLNSV